jgi:uncharacterized protein (TIGR00106 family)
MTVVEFSMFPLGKGESVSEYVARSVDIIDKSKVSYRLNAMGTVMEGEWDELFSVIKKCLDQMTTDCNRVEAVIKVDYRKNVQKGMIDDKVKSVEKKLGRKVRT